MIGRFPASRMRFMSRSAARMPRRPNMTLKPAQIVFAATVYGALADTSELRMWSQQTVIEASARAAASVERHALVPAAAHRWNYRIRYRV